MKNWEIAVIVVFFTLFITLFSVTHPWQQKIGDSTTVDNVTVQFPVTPIVRDSLYKGYEIETGWKFVILAVSVYNWGPENRTFFAGRMEDKDGIVYFAEAVEYSDIKSYTQLSAGEGDFFHIAYKMPTNAVPKQVYYTISNFEAHKSSYGNVLLRKSIWG